MSLFIAKELKKVWNAGPCVCFLDGWEGRNVIVSRDKALCLQKVKFLFFSFFVYFVWSETKNVFCGLHRDPCAFH